MDERAVSDRHLTLTKRESRKSNDFRDSLLLLCHILAAHAFRRRTPFELTFRVQSRYSCHRTLLLFFPCRRPAVSSGQSRLVELSPAYTVTDRFFQSIIALRLHTRRPRTHNSANTSSVGKISIRLPSSSYTASSPTYSSLTRSGN